MLIGSSSRWSFLRNDFKLLISKELSFDLGHVVLSESKVFVLSRIVWRVSDVLLAHRTCHTNIFSKRAANLRTNCCLNKTLIDRSVASDVVLHRHCHLLRYLRSVLSFFILLFEANAFALRAVRRNLPLGYYKRWIRVSLSWVLSLLTTSQHDQSVDTAVRDVAPDASPDPDDARTFLSSLFPDLPFTFPSVPLPANFIIIFLQPSEAFGLLPRFACTLLTLDCFVIFFLYFYFIGCGFLLY